MFLHDVLLGTNKNVPSVARGREKLKPLDMYTHTHTRIGGMEIINYDCCFYARALKTTPTRATFLVSPRHLGVSHAGARAPKESFDNRARARVTGPNASINVFGPPPSTFLRVSLVLYTHTHINIILYDRTVRIAIKVIIPEMWLDLGEAFPVPAGYHYLSLSLCSLALVFSRESYIRRARYCFYSFFPFPVYKRRWRTQFMRLYYKR